MRPEGSFRYRALPLQKVLESIFTFLAQVRKGVDRLEARLLSVYKFPPHPHHS